ncbi:hypothetical protein B0T21DRAFT_335307 [Apiosordaria backusii]|uniref:DUF3074 domain-containing protein n=1 Tax=Apiosordaria backusii TaxID=314023 RepID=A0AA40EAJ4_9PEZI|nr:hypothetical protein B0T21DRAFT_335307 [Apiosordaria backusii]
MGGSTHHEPFKSLSPLSWTNDLSSGTDEEVLSKTITDTFSNAQILIDSLPVSPPHPVPQPPPPRAQTDSAACAIDLNQLTTPHGHSPETKDTIEKLRKEWKEVKTNPRDNPHGITVYKLSAKDGKGAWFGRYSLHHGQDFDKWEGALRREFTETLERCEREGKEPGCGNIRGIGAERVVERREIGGDLWRVISARFGGPTTARDFIALHITPPARKEADGEKKKKKGVRQPRQFMLVSRPVEHPDCPPRSGFIRGVYESVEVIREVPVVKPLRRTRSSGDWGEHDGKGGLDLHADGGSSNVQKEAMIRSAKKAIEDGQDSEEEDVEMAIEWLMVTRSDPGGSVPRFMVEKGTPGGIINDAGQFLKWFASLHAVDEKEMVNGNHEVDGQEGVNKVDGERKEDKVVNGSVDDSTASKDHDRGNQNGELHDHKQGEVTPPSGFYGMIASALGAAGSAVASRVATLAGSTIATDDDSLNDDDDESDTSSELSFASASEGDSRRRQENDDDDAVTTELEKNDSNIDAASTLSSVSPSSLHSNEDGSVTQTSHSASLSSHQAQHEKELKKLQDRMRKAQAKLERSHQRRHHNHHKEQDEAKEEAALQRLKEKHEREIAKQQEKYEREVRRLAEKRAQEERKKEEKRRKAQEREERANMAMELERTRAERDVAMKQIEILKGQVGELQRENTMLVAKLGKLGVGTDI